VKKTLWWLLRLSITAAFIAWVLRKIEFTGPQGILTIFGGSNKLILLLFVCIYLGINLLASLRWQLLLSVQEIRISYIEALRLTFLGFFFNNFMPGLTGGDIVKAYYIAKETKKKPEAVATVFLDRVIGMVAMAILVAVMITWRLSSAAFWKYGWAIFLFLAVLLGMALVFFSRRLRRILRYEYLLTLIPNERIRKILKKADEAFFLYRFHKKVALYTLLISFACHTIAVTVNYGLAMAFGLTEVSFFDFYLFVLLIIMLIALPYHVGGWGARETLYIELFGTVGIPAEIAVSLSVSFRLTEMLWSLPGAYFYVSRRERVSMVEMEKEVQSQRVETIPADGKDESL